MAVVALPDLLGALIGHLRSFSEVTTLTGTRVSAQLQDAWSMPTHAIVLRQVGGPQSPDFQDVKIQRTRVDLTCYGSTGYEAMRLWRTVHPAICPGQGSVCGFTRSGCRVYDVAQEVGPISLADPDEPTWFFVTVPYLITWGEVPA